ncbi:MAG: hypothetical protein JJU45_15000 [Acidimicrobiia bacterium]|nr:hypothetical protein [Acidimicrobiia bacterium]
MTRRLLFSVVAVIALLLAACGGDDASSEATAERPERTERDKDDEGEDTTGAPTAASVALMQQAADNTGEITSGRFEMVMALEGGSVEGELLRAEGAFDETSGRSSMTMDMSGFMTFLSPEDMAGVSQEDAEMAMAMFDEPWEIITDGDTAYMRMALFSAMFGAGDSWIQFEDDTNEFTGDAAFMDADFSGEVLEALKGAGDVEEVGSETVRGADTTRYSVELDPELLAAEVGDPEIAEMAQGAAVMDVWIDGDDLVRRIEMVVDVDAFGDLDDMGELDGDIRVTIEMYDLGEPVDIELPDPADVITEDELFAGMFGGAGGFGLEEFEQFGVDMEGFDLGELEAELDQLLEQVPS